MTDELKGVDSIIKDPGEAHKLKQFIRATHQALEDLSIDEWQRLMTWNDLDNRNNSSNTPALCFGALMLATIHDCLSQIEDEDDEEERQRERELVRDGIIPKRYIDNE